MDNDDGKDSYTVFTPQWQKNNMSLCKVELKTGRMHQIRVHLAYLGTPILGDPDYSKKAGRSGQLLQSYKLGFRHPVSSQWMEFCLPPSDRFGGVSDVD